MGEAAKKLKKLINAGDDDCLVKALGTAEDIYGTMSGLYGYYGAAKDILGKLGVLGKPADPLAEIAGLLKHMNEQLNTILGQILVTQGMIEAASELTTSQLADAELTWAKNAFNNALDFIAVPNDDTLKTGFEESLEHSFHALNVLIEPAENYWRRLFVEDGLYSDSWTPPFYPDHAQSSDKFIWDFRLILPKYLQALQRHLFAVAATTTEYQHVKLDDMKEFGDFLFENVYKKILGAFASIRVPDANELKYVIFAMNPANFYWYRKEANQETLEPYDFIDPKDGRRVRIERFSDREMDWLLEHRIPGGLWIKANYSFGEVERYTGFDYTASYPLNELKAGASLVTYNAPTEHGVLNDYANYWWAAYAGRIYPPGSASVTIKRPAQFQSFYNRFCMRHALRTLRKRNQLYVELGLPKMYQTICSYFAILKLPIPLGLTACHIQYTSWSVREAFQEMLRSIKSNPSPEVLISLRQMAATLGRIPTVISLRRLCLLDEECALL